MLAARGIVMRYGPRTAVDGVDLDLRSGEILGLLGPNGAGKTTLLRRLAGLLPGSAGTVDLGGGDPAVAASARARIGYLPEDPPLYGDDIALQYVTYLAGLSGAASSSTGRPAPPPPPTGCGSRWPARRPPMCGPRCWAFPV